MKDETAKNKKPIFTFICFFSRVIAPRLLSSILKANGYESNIIFLTSQITHTSGILSPQEKKWLLELIDKQNTTFVGISFMSSHFQLAKIITQSIQKELKLPVIWGGVHPTIQPEDCIQIADYICVGEAEATILEIARAISQEKPIDKIPNIWAKNNGHITRSTMRPLLKDLDSLPTPDYGLNGKYYLHRGIIHQGDPLPPDYPEYETLTSRGCPYNCSYCINSKLKEIYPEGSEIIRRRSPAKAIEEIEQAKNYFTNLQLIKFHDEVFTWDQKWVVEFCELYKKKINLPFTCDFHPNVVKSEVVAMLKNVGLESVGFGVQSASQRVRYEVFERPVSDQNLIKSARILQKQKIDLYCDLIMNNPYENEADKDEGLSFLLKFPRPYNWSMFFLRYYPHTTIAEKALQEGIISEEQIEGKGKYSYSNIGDPKTNLKKDEVFWYYLLILASKSFIPRWLIKLIGKNKFFKKFPFIIKPLIFVSHYINMGILGFKKLFRGRLNYALLKIYLRRALTPRN